MFQLPENLDEGACLYCHNKISLTTQLFCDDNCRYFWVRDRPFVCDPAEVPYRNERGSENRNYSVVRYITKSGYIAIKKWALDMEDVMLSAGKDTHIVLEHRLVMAYKLGRPLKPDEVVRHMNGDRTNNHPDNLEVGTVVENNMDHQTAFNEVGRLRVQVRELQEQVAKWKRIAYSLGYKDRG